MNKLVPNFKDFGIISDSNFGFQSFALMTTNQSPSEGIELVGKVTHVVDGDILDIWN
jgi:hypothetical protein